MRVPNERATVLPKRLRSASSRRVLGCVFVCCRESSRAMGWPGGLGPPWRGALVAEWFPGPVWPWRRWGLVQAWLGDPLRSPQATPLSAAEL